MKTLDEVIVALEVCTSAYCSHPKHGDCPYLDERNDCDTRQRKLDALHYLKTIETTENLYHDAVNELSKWKDEDWKDRCLPLTWDELRTMEGKPVWVEMDKPDVIKAWFLICQINDSFVWVRDCKGKSHNFPRVCLDTGLWQAYRKEKS